jgi:hypothetical protein
MNELGAARALPVSPCLLMERLTDGRIDAEPYGGALLRS